jgi:hypothetical protein
LREPIGPVSQDNWPTPYDATFARETRTTLRKILYSILTWVSR